jgi:hypothetical protein
VNICFNSLRYMQRSRTAGSDGNSMFNFLRDSQTVSIVAVPFYISTSNGNFFIFSPTFLIVHLKNHSYPNGCEMVPNCGLDLHRPND